MKLEIAIARPEDAPAWAKLRAELWPDCPPERHELETRELLRSDGMVALAHANREVVGMAEVSIRRDHVEGTTEAPVPYLEGWFVAEPYRNLGVGKSLLEFVENWARTRGFREIASDAELHNAHSISIHSRLGFREVGRSVHFVKSLP